MNMDRPSRIGRRSILAALAAPAWLAAAGHANAQAFPTKPVRLVVPYPPGGATDVVARLVGAELSRQWKQPVLIENLSGASGIVGAQAVQRAASDGHTLLVTVSNTHAILPHMQPLPFDPFRDFSGVVTLARAQSGVFVRSDLPVKTLDELAAYARSRLEPLPIGDWGSGSFGHLLVAGLAIDKQFKATAVHYRGAAPVLQAALSGEIQVASADVSTLLPHINAGKVRMLAVNGAERHPALQAVPTFQELGLDDYASYSWLGVFAPAKTPLPLRTAIAQAIQRACLDSAVNAQLRERGFLVAQSDPAQFEEEWRTTYERFGRLVKKTGIKGEG
jgi:tripartite-type tricarboxylate transporter receptor subunit TctC